VEAFDAIVTLYFNLVFTSGSSLGQLSQILVGQMNWDVWDRWLAYHAVGQWTAACQQQWCSCTPRAVSAWAIGWLGTPLLIARATADRHTYQQRCAKHHGTSRTCLSVLLLKRPGGRAWSVVSLLLKMAPLRGTQVAISASLACTGAREADCLLERGSAWQRTATQRRVLYRGYVAR